MSLKRKTSRPWYSTYKEAPEISNFTSIEIMAEKNCESISGKHKTDFGFVKPVIKLGIFAFAIRFLYEQAVIYAVQGNSQEIYDEPLDWITIPNMFSEDDISELMDFVHEKRRFLTGKEAFMEGVQHIGEGKKNYFFDSLHFSPFVSNGVYDRGTPVT